MSDEKPVPETLRTIAVTIDALSKSVDARFAQVDTRFAQVDARFAQVDARFEKLESQIDRRFAAVDEAFVEQRKYTEFAFDTLRSEMIGGFARLDRKLDRVLDGLTKAPSRRRRSR
jgi:hypothetical protein